MKFFHVSPIKPQGIFNSVKTLSNYTKQPLYLINFPLHIPKNIPIHLNVPWSFSKVYPYLVNTLSIFTIHHSSNLIGIKSFENVFYVVLTKWLYNNLVDNLENVVYIPNGIDLNFFKPNKSFLESEKFTILINAKNFNMLYNILDKLNENDIRVMIYGNHKKIEKSFNFEIIDWGWVENKVLLLHILNGVDVFIPLFGKSMLPNVILENMACQNVPIVLDYYGVDEIIRNKINGYVVNNIDELIEQIFVLKDNKKILRKIGINARTNVDKYFNPIIQANKFLNFYDSISKYHI